MSKICPNCGKINEDDALFCDKCGQKLDEVPVTPEEKPEPEKAEPEKAAPEKAEPKKAKPKKAEKAEPVAAEPEKKEEKKGSKGLIIGLIALLLIGVVAGVLLLGGKKTVTFESNGGTRIAEVKIKKGEKLARPEDPIREGHDFVGWYLDDKEYDFDQPVEDNITLRARWEPYKFVTFMVDGKEIAKEHVVDGHVRFPEAPAQDGYAFVGWMDTSSVEIGEDHVFTADAVLFANYKVFVPITSIGFEKKTYYVLAGDSVKPKLTIKPSDWAENIDYASSDENVATVTPDGTVSGLNAGSVTIKVTSESGKSAECKVVVAKITVADPFTVTAGEKKDLGVKIEPKEAYSKITYKSTDDIVARVDSKGKVSGIEGGKCQIKISTDTGLSKTITVYVDEYTLMLVLDWDKTENAGYLFYRQNDRPVVSIKEAELRTTKNGTDKYTTLDVKKVVKNIDMEGGDNVLYWNSGDNEMYATSYGQVSNGFARVKDYEVYFTYKYDGKTYKSGIYDITVEPTLECEVQGDIQEYNDKSDYIKLTPGEGTKYFTIRVNQDCDHAVSSNLTILGVTHPKLEKGKPAYSVFSCKYVKTSTSSAAWITFLTDGGQRLDIEPIE